MTSWWCSLFREQKWRWLVQSKIMILPRNHLGPNCVYCLILQLHFYSHFNIHTDCGWISCSCSSCPYCFSTIFFAIQRLLIQAKLELLPMIKYIQDFNSECPIFLPPSYLVSSHVFIPPFLMCIILGYTVIFKARSRDKSVCITMSGPEVCTWLLKINSCFLICHQYFLFVKK